MNDLTFSLRVKEWNDTVEQYTKFTRKSAEEATFRQAKNLLFFISREMPESQFKRGQKPPRLSTYFKNRPWVAGMLIATHFKRKGAMIVKLKHKQRGEIGRAFMTQGSRGRYKFAGWHNGSRAVYYTKEMAIAENKRRIRMIANRFGFAQLIPLKAVNALREVAKKYGINIGSFVIKGNKPNKKHQGEDAIVKITKGNDRIDLSIVSSYTFKNHYTMFGKMQSKNAEFYDNAFRTALPNAMANAVLDMKQYMAKKMAQKINQVSK